MFNFTPLLGAQSQSSASQSLLELEGGVKLLIDVGWDETFDVRQLKALEKQIPSLSLILLTHATTAHLAAFAHCCKHFPLFTQLPIYATVPVISLGRTLLQDIYASTPLASTVVQSNSLDEASYLYPTRATDSSLDILQQPPTSEEIAAYFSLIHPLKYSQPHQPLPSPFSPPLNGLTITAYNAGHTLGGTIWHVQHGMESIVYAVDWNQVRENILGGAAWLGGSGGNGADIIEQLRKPTVLVCSTKGADINPLAGGRKKRDDLLLDMIGTALAKGGTILIPTDTSARVLELAYLLEHAWRREHSDGTSKSPLKSSRLYLASKHVGATMTYARSMLEWMDDNVVQEFETEATNNEKRQHKRTDSKQIARDKQAGSNKEGQAASSANGPFDFKYLKLLERKRRLDKVLSTKGPRVILASDTSLEWGFSKDVLMRIAGDPANLIVLTERLSNIDGQGDKNKDGLGHILWRWYQERIDGVAIESGSDGQNLEQVHTGGRQLEITIPLQVALEGKELFTYQHYLATRRQLQNTLSANVTELETSADAVDEISSTSSSSSEDSDPEQQGIALNASTTLANSNRHRLGTDKEAIGVNALLAQSDSYDFDVRGKKGRDTMFPFVTKRRRGDDFGDLIKPEDYLRAEERDETDGQDVRETSGKETGLGNKRKWGDSGMQISSGGRGLSGKNKRRQLGVNQNSDGKMNGTNGLDNANGLYHPGDESLSEGSQTESEDEAYVPSKLMFQTDTVQSNLRIAYVDFAGLHDQRSLSMLIPLIQPKKLILIGGNESDTRYLADNCRQNLVAQSTDSSGRAIDDIFTPFNGQTISASVDTNAWTVKLSESLAKLLHWQNVRGLGIVTLMGRLAASTADEQPQAELHRKRRKLLKNEAEDPEHVEEPSNPPKASNVIPTLDVLPTSMKAATRSVAQPLHVGDLRLADLRKILQSTGHTAEFRGEGTLLVDGLVAVRKSGTGKIEIENRYMTPELRTRELEGPFYTVKRQIYEGLAVIAGG